MSPTLNPQLNAILGRRSIRTYTEEKVTQEVITQILQAAMAAPSACAKDPWRFIVITEKKILSHIADVLPNGNMLAKAGVGFCICGSLDHAHDHQLSYMLQDCSAAIENMLLAIHALGLGAVWLGVHPREERIEAVREILSIPDSITPVSCIAAGYPAEKRSLRTRFNADYVHYERW